MSIWSSYALSFWSLNCVSTCKFDEKHFESSSNDYRCNLCPFRFCRFVWGTFIQLINFVMIYKIIRHDKESDDITEQSFNSYNEAYDLLEEIFTDVCCSDADYEDRPYYEIIKVEE